MLETLGHLLVSISAHDYLGKWTFSLKKKCHKKQSRLLLAIHRINVRLNNEGHSHECQYFIFLFTGNDVHARRILPAPAQKQCQLTWPMTVYFFYFVVKITLSLLSVARMQSKILLGFRKISGDKKYNLKQYGRCLVKNGSLIEMMLMTAWQPQHTLTSWNFSERKLYLWKSSLVKCCIL